MKIEIVVISHYMDMERMTKAYMKAVWLKQVYEYQGSIFSIKLNTLYRSKVQWCRYYRRRVTPEAKYASWRKIIENWNNILFLNK